MSFSNYDKRLQFVQARLQALSTLGNILSYDMTLTYFKHVISLNDGLQSSV